MNFNPAAITNSPYRMCENPKCHHINEFHKRNECEKCECKNFEVREDTIYLFYDNCGHSFSNFLERKCPNCKEKTTMKYVGTDLLHDPFYYISPDTDKIYATQTAVHDCSKCGFVSFYSVDVIFNSVLHDLTFKAELKKRKAQNKK